MQFGQNISFDDEPFDLAEMRGYYNGPTEVFGLVSLSASLDIPYYNEDIYPLTYYGIDNKYLKLRRHAGSIGIPPANGIYLYEIPWNLELSEAQIAQGYAPSVSGSNFFGRVDNYAFYYMYQDYLDIKAQN